MIHIGYPVTPLERILWPASKLHALFSPILLSIACLPTWKHYRRVPVGSRTPFAARITLAKFMQPRCPKPSSLGFSSIDTLIFVARYVYRTRLQNYRPSSYYYSTIWENKLRETERIARHPVLFERSIAPSALRNESPAPLDANFSHRVDRVL